MTHRDPWTVSLEAPAPDADPHALLRFALHVALTAPSPGNSQPWRFLLGDEHVDLFTDPGRALPVRDPEGQQRLIAGGAALGLLRVTLRALGLGETTTLLPGDHPDLLARVALSGSVAATPEETWLLQAAPKRRTHRGLMSARPVRERLLQRLQAVARDQDTHLLILETSRQRAALAARVDADLRARDTDAAWNDERRAWPEPGPYPFEDNEGGPARGPAILEGAPVLALLTTAGDDPLAWLRAGEALIRVLLRGRVDHLYASFLQGPLTHRSDRRAIAEEAAVLGDMPQTPGYAQLALRLGYGSDLAPTPRRPLSEVLLAAPP
jgi:hypothetical protein